MSWLIYKNGGYLAQTPSTLKPYFIDDRDPAKRFETKHDARDFNDKYDLNGHIIPA